jgi:hypothetical protein
MTGTLTGVGKFIYNDGIVYDGSIVNGIPNGEGVITYADGATFTGIMTDKGTGVGTIDYKNGHIYTGNVVNSAPMGQGKMKYPDTSVYEGGFNGYAWSGQGVYTWKTGETFTGIMTAILAGNGTIDYKNGYIYTGAVVNGQPNGQGTMKYPNGSTVTGNFVNGVYKG